MQNHLLRLAARSTMRHRARTALTAGMVAMSVMLLIVALSWLNGVFGQMLSDATSMAGHVRIVKKEYAQREQLAPLYENLQPVAPLVELLERQPGVVSVQPRITTGVTVTVGEEIGDVFAILVGAPDSTTATTSGPISTSPRDAGSRMETRWSWATAWRGRRAPGLATR